MLDIASDHLAKQGVDRPQVVRIDVPGRGAGKSGDGTLRGELEPLVPASSIRLALRRDPRSPTGRCTEPPGRRDRSAGKPVAGSRSSGSRVSIFWSWGSTPKRLAAVAKDLGSSVSIRKMWERQAPGMVSGEVRRRGLAIDRGAGEPCCSVSALTSRRWGKLSINSRKPPPRSPGRWFWIVSRTGPTSRVG